MNRKQFVTISEAAELMGVSIQTLRRWHDGGRFRAATTTLGGHRLYTRAQIDLFLHDLIKLGLDWVEKEIDIPYQMYCERSAIFQARLDKLSRQLFEIEDISNIAPLIVAVCGEIGNNSFDHNIGKWPDIPGVFFAYDVSKRLIVLGDRGRGVLTTLRQVRPALASDAEALIVAFTEIISGRAPESRGKGLKFVHNVATEYPISVSFQSGNSTVEISQKTKGIFPELAHTTIRGCFAVIKF
jgi:excisionase family DNA binding protein